MLSVLKAINAGLAFAIEIAMLVAFADWGFRLHASSWWRWTAAFGAPALAVVLWAIWCAPTSTTRLRPPGLYLLEWSMFAIAAACLYFAGHGKLSVVFLAIASGNVVLWVVLERSR
ncbi:MAG TPA: YrdB family protein [Polyangiales bacterium]|jgi:hypothetical protein